MKLSGGSSFYVECVLMAWQRVVDAPSWEDPGGAAIILEHFAFSSLLLLHFGNSFCNSAF